MLACHQTPDYNAWYRGSADAVRRNLPVILEQYRGAGIPEELLILSGQAIYRMACLLSLLAVPSQESASMMALTQEIVSQNIYIFACLLCMEGDNFDVQDYMDLLKTHRENDADITIATHSVGWGQAPLRGLTRVDPDTGRVVFSSIFLGAAIVVPVRGVKSHWLFKGTR